MNRVNFYFPKNDYQCLTAQSQQQYDQFENLYISSHGYARSIKSGWQVNLIQRVPLGTLPHNTLTLFISNHRSYCYQIWPVTTP